MRALLNLVNVHAQTSNETFTRSRQIILQLVLLVLFGFQFMNSCLLFAHVSRTGYRGCAHTVLSTVYVTVGRQSVRLSVPSNDSGFAAERRLLQQVSMDSCGRRAVGAGAQQHMRSASC